MRLLWLSHLLPYPPIGGVCQRSFHLIREAALEFEVHLVALRQHAMQPDAAAVSQAVAALREICASVSVHEIDWEISRVQRLRHAAAAILGRDPYDVARFSSQSLTDALLGGDLPRFDVAHVDTLGLIPYAMMLGGKARCVLNHHNIESSMMRRRAQRAPSSAHALLFRHFARRLRQCEQRDASEFISNLVVSQTDADRLGSISPTARIQVVPNGCDTAFFDAPANGDAMNHNLLFVGGLGWYPNRDAVEYFVAEIWPIISRRAPHATFTVIGAQPSRRLCIAARRDFRIRLLGFVPDIRGHAAHAAVFVAPFRTGGGTRLKLLDALSMRKAVVSTPLGAEGLQVRDGFHLRIADGADAFAAAVLELLDDPKARVRLGEQGRSLVCAQYDWQVIGRKLRAVYKLGSS